MRRKRTLQSRGRRTPPMARAALIGGSDRLQGTSGLSPKAASPHRAIDVLGVRPVNPA